MKTLNARQLLRLLESFDWTGQFELPEATLRWLAEKLANALSGDGRRCDNCGNRSPILVKLAMGEICEECAGDAVDIAREQRAAQE